MSPKDRFRIVVLPGDGVGPEVTAEAVKVLQGVGRRFGRGFDLSEMPAGWAAIDRHGEALPSFVREACAQADAVLLGAVGLPDRDAALPQEERPERAVLLPLREGNFANIRPVWRPACMGTAHHPAVDMVIVRELTGGIYTGQPRGRREVEGIVVGFDTMSYSVPEIERVARVAFGLARRRSRRLCSVDKANMLASSLLWRETVERLAADEYPDVEVRHQLVDSAAPLLIQKPELLDVIVTGNLFGDILSDLAGVLAGSLGMLPSACIGGVVPLSEPCHGTAPDIAGRGIANPVGAILTIGMLLEDGLKLPTESAAVWDAVTRVLESGLRTVDVMSEGARQVGTSEFGDHVAEAIESA